MQLFDSVIIYSFNKPTNNKTTQKNYFLKRIFFNSDDYIAAHKMVSVSFDLGYNSSLDLKRAQVFGTSGDHSVVNKSRRYDTSDNKSPT